MKKQFRNTYYQVDEYGNVYGRHKGGREIKLKYRIIKGYVEYNLCIYDESVGLEGKRRGKRKHFLAHRLVAELFLNDWDEKLFVNHKDFNKENNHISNLEMMTTAENNRHYIDTYGSHFTEYNSIRKGKTYEEIYGLEKGTYLRELKKKKRKLL